MVKHAFVSLRDKKRAPDMRGMTVCKHPISDLFGCDLVLPDDKHDVCEDCLSAIAKMRNNHGKDESIR